MYTHDELSEMTVSDLRSICRDYGCVGYSHALKSALINMVRSAQNVSGDGGEPLREYVTVISGVFEKKFETAVGTTVKTVLDVAREFCTISPNALTFVNGEKVSSNFVLCSGDVLEAKKESGDKG